MDRATYLVEKILENKALRKAITENDFGTIEMCLITELEENENLKDFMFATREREYHREDVREEINFLNNEWNEYEPEKHIIATDEDIEHITDLYEESLGDSDDWHEHLVWALNEFEKERGGKTMLNFENLDGFVVDLSTEQLCNEVLEDILCGDDKEFKKVIDLGIYSKREYITNYFADTYKYIFYKGNNVYQICEEELNTRETNSSITELQDGYNLIKIYRNDIIEYFVEKVGYANLYYICGTAKEYDVDNNYLKSFIDVAEEIKFWGENEDE